MLNFVVAHDELTSQPPGIMVAVVITWYCPTIRSARSLLSPGFRHQRECDRGQGFPQWLQRQRANVGVSGCLQHLRRDQQGNGSEEDHVSDSISFCSLRGSEGERSVINPHLWYASIRCADSQSSSIRRADMQCVLLDWTRACDPVYSKANVCLIADDPLLHANSPGFSNGYFAGAPPSHAVDGHASTHVYTYSSADAYLVFGLDKDYDIEKISVNVYGCKLYPLSECYLVSND